MQAAASVRGRGPGLARRAFVVGGAITPFIGAKHPDFIKPKDPRFGTKDGNPSLEAHIGRAVREALQNTSTPGALVDRSYIGNFAGQLFSRQGILGAAVAGADPGLANKPAMRVEGACASGGLAFMSALESLSAGADVCLVVGAEVQTTVSAREGADYLATASYYSEQAVENRVDDFVFPAVFANKIKAARERYGVTPEDLATLSRKAYGNAARNPLAHMHAADSPAGSAGDVCFLSNPDLSPYLRLSDCSQVSDGGAALVLASEDGLAKIGKTPADCVEVLGLGCAASSLFTTPDPLALPTCAAAGVSAFTQAGIAPKDVGLLELHDCFTITELLMLDALGFAEAGHGVNLARDGALGIDGALPCNTGGGLVGFGHPVGATGVKQILEVFRQMKGQCGDYQVPNTPEFGVTANLGGDDKTCVVTVLGNL